MKIRGEVVDGSGANGVWVRRGLVEKVLNKVPIIPVQMPSEVPAGAGAEMRVSKALAEKMLGEVPKVPVQIPCEVPEGSGADVL